MRTSAPIQVTVQMPRTEADRQELARRAAEVHADFVLDTIRSLPGPARQKLALLQAVIDTVRGSRPAPALPASGQAASSAPQCQDTPP